MKRDRQIPSPERCARRAAGKKIPVHLPLREVEVVAVEIVEPRKPRFVTPGRPCEQREPDIRVTPDDRIDVGSLDTDAPVALPRR